MLMYGLAADISQHEMREILGWLLLTGVLHLAAGNFIWKRRVSHEYMRLIRYGCFSKWWHGLYARVLGLCLALTLLVFAAAWVFQFAVWGRPVQELMEIGFLQAFYLFFLNFCFFSVIQMLLINMGQWEKFSFLMVMVIEVLSLYGKAIWKESVYWMPGSWKMYIRSSWYLEEGYNAAVTSAIQMIWILVCFLIGYKLLDRRK